MTHHWHSNFIKLFYNLKIKELVLNKSKILLLSAVCSLFIFTGCENIQGPAVPESKLTPGKVQQNVAKGMSSTEVIKALGTPNIYYKR